MWHVYMSFLAFNSVPCTGVNHINRSVNQSIHIVLYVASESEALIGVNRFKVTNYFNSSSKKESFRPRQAQKKSPQINVTLMKNWKSIRPQNANANIFGTIKI